VKSAEAEGLPSLRFAAEHQWLPLPVLPLPVLPLPVLPLLVVPLPVVPLPVVPLPVVPLPVMPVLLPVVPMVLSVPVPLFELELPEVVPLPGDAPVPLVSVFVVGVEPVEPEVSILLLALLGSFAGLSEPQPTAASPSDVTSRAISSRIIGFSLGPCAARRGRACGALPVQNACQP